VANQAGRQIEQQLINQPFAQQRTIELEAGFGVNLVDAAPGQQFEQGFEVNLVAAVIQNFDEISR